MQSLHRPLSRLGPSLLCIAAGAAAYQLAGHDTSPTSRCEFPTAPSNPPVPPTAVSVMALRRWLEHQGADISAIDFKASPTDAGRFGIFANTNVRSKAARGWWGSLKASVGYGPRNVALASFPLSTALTASNVLREGGQQAELLRELAELGVADERLVVMLHLLVERLRERESKLCPWLTLLPRSFGTTLFFSERELDWLRGTTLHKATLLRRKTLEEQWRRLEPACCQLALQEGLDARPTLQDFLWAYSVFWSRAISFPCPSPEGRVQMQEGLIPGLDFANHAPGAPARWTVFGAEDTPRGQTPTAVTLIAPRKGGGVPKPGQEVLISYGSKSNEELLFLYGFALEHNPDDLLHVPCPLPAEWDEKFAARMQLLAARGLRPQLFLPAAFLEQQQQQRSPAGSGSRRWWWQRWRGSGSGSGGSGGSSGGAGTASGTGLGADLPEGVFETLEVFTLEHKEVMQELQRIEQAADAASAAAASSAAGSGALPAAAAAAAAQRRPLGALEASGLRLAVLTTLVRLLELRVLAQEGEEGTGTLESDERLLAADGGRLTTHERHALWYRMGQKRLAREYLVYGKGLLEREMQSLKVLMGSEE